MSSTVPYNDPPLAHDIPSPSASPAAKRPKIALSSPPAEMAPSAVTVPSIESSDAPPTAKVEDGPALLIKKLSPKGRAPTRGSAFAAGYDLYSAQNTFILGGGSGLVNTDIAVAVPAGTYGRIAPRSGLASKYSITTGAGVIDADYRGQVKVLLFNHGAADFEVKEGDRIAQMVLERIYTPEVMVVEDLEESVRGEGGFGSTG